MWGQRGQEIKGEEGSGKIDNDCNEDWREELD